MCMCIAYPVTNNWILFVSKLTKAYNKIENSVKLFGLVKVYCILFIGVA